MSFENLLGFLSVMSFEILNFGTNVNVHLLENIGRKMNEYVLVSLSSYSYKSGGMKNSDGTYGKSCS